MTSSDHEEPLADVIEQHQAAAAEPDDSDQTQVPGRLPLEADVADAAEQAQEVDLDDEDYR